MRGPERPGSNVVRWRVPRQAVETIEQAVSPQPDRIALFEERKRTDAPCPLERAEHGVISVERLIAGEERLRHQRPPQRSKIGAKGRKLRLAIGDEILKRHPDALLARRPKIVAVLFRDAIKDIQRDERENRTDQAISHARIVPCQVAPGIPAEQ